MMNTMVEILHGYNFIFWRNKDNKDSKSFKMTTSHNAFWINLNFNYDYMYICIYNSCLKH